MKRFKTIVLAAGKGVRMKSDLPKILHPICGRPMIDYVLNLAKSLDSLKTYVVLGHQNATVKKHLGGKVTVVIQKKLLGTADAIKSAQSFFRGDQWDVLVLSGDAPLLTKETIQGLLRKHRATKAGCTFLTAIVDCPCGYGRVIRDGQNQVIAIREDLDATEEEKKINEINAGVYCFHSRQLFDAIKTIGMNKKKKEFYLTDIMALFLEKNLTIETVTTQDQNEALGINTREDLACAHAVLRRRILRDFMLSGVTIEDPDTTYIDAGVKIGRDTTVHPYAIIENNVQIGSRCSIGPFCHIRPYSKIGNDVQLGNFTEVSRSTVGQGTLMKHFSFIGDAKIGKNVNIGAGVVTANFDGKNKNTTTIFDEAFIGSDSILVAPVRVGKGAMTGAGCVVTRHTNVPNGAIAFGVPAKIRRR